MNNREELPTPSLFVVSPPLSGPSQLSAMSSACEWLQVPSGPPRPALQLSGDFWTLTFGLDSRDCPSQWTCIFPLVLFLNPAVLSADCRPHPCPHPPLYGLLTGVQTLRLHSYYCLQADPPSHCSLSLAPFLNLEQPEV